MANPIVQERTFRDSSGRTTKRHLYWCPGCALMNGGHGLHAIAIRPDVQENGAGWEFTGTLEKPTYAPSQLSRSPRPEGDHVCHTFIREGMIQYLDDCTHELRGQTVPMVPLPDWLVKERSEEL